MKLSEAIKPVSYFKNHMAEAIRHLNENQGTMIITQNGVAKAAIIDIKEFEQIQETLAMLKLILESRIDQDLG
jgi:prevent-host-death family protein